MSYMTDIGIEHEAIRKLHRRITESFPTMRRDGCTDQEIISEIVKDDDIYLAGEERFWNSPEEYEAIVREEAIKLKQMLMTLDEMIVLVKRYIDMPDAEIAMLLLWSISTRLRGFLRGELCCYVHFRGRSGTGKSHAGRFLTDISRGDWHEAISEGALLNGVQSGRVMGLDEVDNDIKRLESAEGILRTGHTWDAKYTLRIKNKEGNFETESILVGGPKVLTSIGQLDDALESRCYVIDMAESPRKQELSLAWLYRADDTERIARSLDGWAEFIKGRHTPDEIDNFHHSPEYLPKLAKLKSCGARRTDLAHIFVTVDWLLGWNTPGLIDALAIENENEETTWLKTTLLDIVSDAIAQGIDVEQTGIQANKLLELLNAKRKTASLPSWSARTFGKNMTELGFSEQGFKVRSGNGYFYRFPEPAMKMLEKNTPAKIVQSVLAVEPSLDEKVAQVKEMVRMNRPPEEIEQTVGHEVFEHCRTKGMVPIVERREA